MSEVLQNFFTTGYFIPHGHCYLWKPGLVSLHVLSDMLIAIAYFSIPLTLLYFVQKRKDLPFNWIFLLFGAFIVACGTSHLMEVWTLWHPTYWLSGTIKAIAAGVSVYTALMLVQLIPQALALPSPAQLEAANQELQHQINVSEASLRGRQRAEEALRESERRFRAIFDQTFQFIGLLQPDGILLEVNQTALKFGGLSYASVIGSRFWETPWWTISEETQNNLQAAIAVAASGEFVRYEVDVQGAGGTIATIDFSLKPVFDENEQVVLLIPEGRDITERKQTLAALLLAQEELENRVQERTADLARVNEVLQAEIAERKRVEQALREITRLQQAILDSANYTIISTTLDGMIMTFNAAAERWLGYTAAEVVEKTTPVIIHNQDEVVKKAQEISQELGVTIEPGFEVFVAKARRGEVEEREWSYIRKDGSHFPILLSVTALRDAENQIVGFLGIGSDISERKRAEEKSRESEERYRSLAVASSQVVWTTNGEGEFIKDSLAWRILTGQTQAEMQGLGWLNMAHPDDRSRYFQVWVQAIARKTVFEVEHRLRTIDGSYRDFLVRGVPILDIDENIREWVGTCTDITNRKQAEEEVRRLGNALESAVEGISQLDTEGHYIHVNPAYASMLGYELAELIGMEWLMTVHPEDREKMIAAYHRMLANKKVELEVRGLRKDGSIFDKQVVMVKAYKPNLEFIGYYCFMKDISDRREVERLKDEFISVVSHELRTPLTSISGALDLLASGVLQTQPDEAQRMLNIAANNTDRLVRLINDILDIERIESGKVQMTKQICDAFDLTIEAAETMQEIAEQAGVTLSVSPLSVRIWADSDRIIQVLTNLLSNAIKFSPPGSTVCLSVELGNEDSQTSTPQILGTNANRKQILFKVKDTGRGIPADKIELIFERFQQVDASDSRQKGGTGLGLAICRSILQHHGGRIWAESNLGEGSTFLFTLPALWESQAETTNVANEQVPLILQCDDDPDLRVVVQTMLERQGYRFLAVGSGFEAVDAAVKHHPSVIILNLMMPGMDGWETLAVLKEQVDTQNIPVIILSGLFPNPSEELPAGISDWIVKPPSLKLLCQSLEKALAKQNQSLKVLIVEDDVDLAQVLITMFHRHEVESFHAQTGREAIEVSQQLIPDLLVLDLGLPEYDGFAVVDWLRQHNRLCRVPLVVYTAQDLDQSDRQRLKLGQTLFLTKGRITPQEFEQRVINLLNRMIHGQEVD